MPVDPTLHSRTPDESESILDQKPEDGAGALPELLSLHDRLARKLAGVAREGGSAAIACTADGAGAERAIGTWRGRTFHYADAEGIDALRGLGGTVGLARYPEHGLDPAELIRAAARAAGDATPCGALEARARAGHRRPPPEPAALAEGRVMLHYQPQVGLADDRIHGLEALMRIFSRPDNGASDDGAEPPGTWISGATTAAQLSEELLRWTFARARDDLESWRAAGLEPVWVAVNLPIAAFDDDALTELIIELTADADEADGSEKGGRFEIELTEDQPPEDLAVIARNLDRLRASGPRVALDDIGTGFAGISLLDRLPLDAAKIDKAFVAGLPGDAEARAIVETIVARGHARGLTVIGEGVELPEQRAVLAELGCDLYQGFGFSPPVSADAVARLLRA